MNRLNFLVLIFGLSLSYIAQAQKGIGIRISGVGSKYVPTNKADEYFDSQMAYSLAFGISYIQPIGPGGFSISPEVGFNYQQENTIQAENSFIDFYKTSYLLKGIGLQSIKRTEKVNTFEFNLLFKYKFPAKFISPYFISGPSWIFASGNGQGQESFVYENSNPVNKSNVEPYTVQYGSSSADRYQSTTFGWILEAGLNAEFEFGNLGIGLRYFSGVNILNSKSDYYKSIGFTSEDKMKLKNLMLNVSYTYPLGGY